MKWEGNRESDNVEDRRSEGSGGGGSFGGRSIGIATIVIALIGSYVLGINPITLLNVLSGAGSIDSIESLQQAPAQRTPASDHAAKFVSTVLADTEDTWSALFQAQGQTYARPKLVLFSGSTPTACGTGQSVTGPFYCPLDRKVYIDLSFFQLMQQRFKVSGEFAQAYVIAHEVGHHVQNLLGYSAKVDQARHQAGQHASQSEANAMSVRLELQADCFAGVWAFHANAARNILERGDVETALNAATAIGDDALQRQSQGHVVPDSFTHGTSAQRVRWFTNGIEHGDIARCDTFKARRL